MFLQGSLFGLAEPAIDHRPIERSWLDDETWIDHAPGWLAGADEMFDALVDRLPWVQRRGIRMYDRLVDEPRLVHWWTASSGTSEPLDVLGTIRHELSQRYGVGFDSIGFNLYRDGTDSVAWHGDRHRERVTNPIVAILSVGASRPLRLRPRGGGPSQAWALGYGDLFVMGGACQHRWEHSVPKVHQSGPRISITFRHDAR
jgi:alkylated DNA repair dioxygenase AlkB